jgi:hypothetical protein
MDECTLITFQWRVMDNLKAFFSAEFQDRLKVVHQESGVGLGGGTKVVVNAEANLHMGRFEPTAASLGQPGGLGRFRQAQGGTRSEGLSPIITPSFGCYPTQYRKKYRRKTVLTQRNLLTSCR